VSSSGNVLPIAVDLSRRPQGFSNGEFASAAGITASAAGAYIAAYVQRGHIFRGAPEGKHGRYFDTADRARAFAAGNEKPGFRSDASPEAIAREAVAHMRKQMQSTFALAELCKVQPRQVDEALAPLVTAGKLTRVDVLRKGVAEFDYRWSATWVPTEADFASCKGGGSAPAARTSPIAPPAPGKLASAPAPGSPSRSALPDDHVRTGRSGGVSKAAKTSLDRAFAQSPQSVGWALAPSETKAREPETSRPSAETCASDRGTKGEVLDTSVKPVSLQIEVTDLVCALNSRGELALDLGDDVLVKFKPKHALVLTRFLAGTTVLEQMHARGEL
jgi:hypothetical protein